MYVELHAASAFSFLQGASLPEALVERAAALGYPALALLDADGVYGAPRFHKAAQRAGLRAIIGAELTIASKAVVGAAFRRPIQEHTWRLPVLVALSIGQAIGTLSFVLFLVAVARDLSLKKKMREVRED